MPPVISLRGFAGETPKVQPYYLPETHAVESIGARLDRGDLTPFNAMVAERSFPSAQDTIYIHGAEWLSWDGDADAVPGPVATDRLYVTRAGAAPIMRVDGVDRPLSLPTPTEKPVATINGTLDSALAEDVIYAWTWVTSLGEETAPSPPSSPVLWSPGCTATVQGLPAASPVANRLISGKRIYRSQTGASGSTDLYFVAEIAATATTYLHNPATTPLQEAIATKDFDPVPANLQGLVAMPNGIMAGFTGKRLWFCEPFQPHAWPNAYSQTMNDFIVGLAAFGTSLAVLTTGRPYLVQGLHPSQMAMEQIEQPFPCIAKRGIVDMGYAAIYPSPDGLVQIGPNGAGLISQALWTPKQWRDLSPHNIRAARYGTRYAFLHPDGATKRLSMVDTTGAQPFVVPTSERGRSLLGHDNSGSLFILNAAGTGVSEFDPDDSPAGTFTWKSKPFRMTAALSIGVGIVDTDGSPGAMTLRVYCDGAMILQTTLKDRPFRFPPNLGREWKVEITGACTVIQIRLARSMGEIDG